MRRSRLLTLGGIGYTAVIALAALVLVMGALGLVLKVAAAAGALPSEVAKVANALPGLKASVDANPAAGSLSSVSVST